MIAGCGRQPFGKRVRGGVGGVEMQTQVSDSPDGSSPSDALLAFAAADWGFQIAGTRLIRDGCNQVFETRLLNGEPLIVRISDDTRRDLPSIERELNLLDRLALNDCAVPAPVRNLRDELFTTYEPGTGRFHVAAFRRLEGHILWCRHAITGRPEFQRQLGREIGRIHRIMDSLNQADAFEFGSWFDLSETCLPSDLPDVYRREIAGTMMSHQEEMRGRLTEANPRHLGLIHGDLHGMNMLYDQGKLWLLDFEFACRSWRVAELTVYLSCEHLNPRWRPDGETDAADDARQFLVHLAAGYREEFGLDPAQFEVMPDLLRLRESFLYSLMKPDPERFDDSVPIQRGSHAAMLKGIEKRWENGLPDYGIDFSGI